MAYIRSSPRQSRSVCGSQRRGSGAGEVGIRRTTAYILSAVGPLPLGDCCCEPRKVDAAQQLAHPPFYGNHLPEGIGLRRADGARVAHFCEKLYHDIIVGLDLDSQERRAQEVFEGIDDSVQELEHQEGLYLC